MNESDYRSGLGRLSISKLSAQNILWATLTQGYLKLAIPVKQLLGSPEKRSCMYLTEGLRRSAAIQLVYKENWAFLEDVKESAENHSIERPPAVMRPNICLSVPSWFRNSICIVRLTKAMSEYLLIIMKQYPEATDHNTLWQLSSNICYSYSNNCSCNAITFANLIGFLLRCVLTSRELVKSISNQCEPLMRASKQIW